MLYRFKQNLGSIDAAECSRACNVRINYKECVIDAVVDLSQEAADWFNKKYKALIEPVDGVKGVAKKPEITAPAK